MSLGGVERISLRQVMEGICDKIGKAEEDLTYHERGRIQRSTQDALEYIWNFDTWPDLRRFMRCLYYPEYSASETLAEGDVRFSDDYYWQALQAEPTDAPSESSEQWEQYDVEQKLIAWTVDEYVIGIPKTLYDFDPRIENCGMKYTFTITRDGLYVEPSAPNVLWLEYLPPSPILRADDWESGLDYAAGDHVYYDKAGNVFRALVDNSDVTPGTDVETWEQVVIPARFGQYIQWIGYSRELSAGRQSKEATLAEDKATEHLFRAIDIARGMTGTYGEPFMRKGNY